MGKCRTSPSIHAGERTNLACYAANKTWKIEILHLPMLVPWGEVAQLSIIPIIGKPHLWTNQDYFAVSNDDSAVVCYALVSYGPIQRERTMAELVLRIVLVSVSSHSKIAYNSLNRRVL